MQGAPLVKVALGWLPVAAIDVLVWLAVTVKRALGRLLVAALSVPVWLAVYPIRRRSRWRSASWLSLSCRTRRRLTSRSGLLC